MVIETWPRESLCEARPGAIEVEGGLLWCDLDLALACAERMRRNGHAVSVWRYPGRQGVFVEI